MYLKKKLKFNEKKKLSNNNILKNCTFFERTMPHKTIKPTMLLQVIIYYLIIEEKNIQLGEEI